MSTPNIDFSKIQAQIEKKRITKQNRELRAAARKYEAEQETAINEALDFIENYPEDKPITLEYVFACSKASVASEYFGNKENDKEQLEFAKECALIVKDVFNDGKLIGTCPDEHKRTMFESVKFCLDILARLGDFDSFCLALEYYRPFKEQFYYPRRDIFTKLGIIQDLQDLYDRKVDVLAISLPQRTGKSRLGLFFVLFMKMTKLSKQRQIFCTGHSQGLMKSFYDEVLMYFSDTSTYRTFEIFGGHQLARTSAEYLFIDIDKQKGMPDLVFRSIDGTVTGAVEGGLLMYADDLIKDENEVLNTDIANKIWDKFNALVLGRMKKNVPLLYMGTIWGLNCPITRLKESFSQENLEASKLTNIRCRFRAFSWHDENGESQFNYKFGVGFDTMYFKRLELTMKRSNPALWSAMYLAKPISREFKPFSNLQFYTELPERKHDYAVSAIDVAISVDGDNWSAPIGYVYETERELYIEDVVYSNKGVDKTLPRTVDMLMVHNVIKCEVEEKEATQNQIQTGIGAKIREMLEKRNVRINIHSHSAAGLKPKRERILAYRTDILGIATETGWTVYFNENKYMNNMEYKQFVDDIMNWSDDEKVQRKQVDDGVDSISQMLRFCVSSGKAKINTSSYLSKLL